MVQNMIKDHKVIIFYDSKHHPSIKSQRHMERGQIDFTHVDFHTNHDEDKWRDAVKNISKVEELPVIFVEGKPIKGMKDLYNKTASGEFQKMLDKAGVYHDFSYQEFFKNRKPPTKD